VHFGSRRGARVELVPIIRESRPCTEATGPNEPGPAGMGQTLSAPVTAKDSGDGHAKAKGLIWGHSCMQGWRVQMEDAHFAIPALEGIGWVDTAAFGVMDGHGGKEVAKFCERHLPPEIARGSADDARGALVAAFHRMDEKLGDEKQSGEFFRSMSRGGGLLQLGPEPQAANPDCVGCTCVVCLVRPDAIVVANTGDSRAVLSRSRQAVPLSEDHKPNLPAESERIRRAGGSVYRQQVGPTVQFRVNGNLNLSRSIGDLQYKKNPQLSPAEQMICSTPDVVTFRREAGDEFLIVACDGIWDVLGSQDAVDFVHERLPHRLRTGRPLSGIMEEMLDYCISPDLSLTHGIGGDNMTAMLVVFGSSAQPGEPPPPPAARLLTPSRSGDARAVVEERAIAPAGFCSCKKQLSR